jgi:hypothetical protein
MLPIRPALLQSEEVRVQFAEDFAGHPDAKVVGPSTNDRIDRADNSIDPEAPAFAEGLF